MYNYIVIDGVLDDIRSTDRVSILKQNIIDIFWQMTKKSRDMRNIGNAYEILQLVVKDQFYVGSMILDTSLRVHLIF